MPSMLWALHRWSKVTAIEVESVEADSPAKRFEDCGHISWNDSQTCILIAHFKDNPILWDTQLKDNAVQRCHLVFPCERAQRILVVVSDWLNFWFCGRDMFHYFMASLEDLGTFCSLGRVPWSWTSWSLFSVTGCRSFWIVFQVFDRLLII